jgi:hypothetical protein
MKYDDICMEFGALVSWEILEWFGYGKGRAYCVTSN